LNEDWILDSIPHISLGIIDQDTAVQFVIQNILGTADPSRVSRESIREASFKFQCVSEFILLVCQNSLGLSFFTTERGFSGFSEILPQRGDRVVLLHGMKTPALLRPISSDSFRILGLAFVSGIMDLEEMGKFRRNGILADEEFKIV